MSCQGRSKESSNGVRPRSRPTLDGTWIVYYDFCPVRGVPAGLQFSCASRLSVHRNPVVCFPVLQAVDEVRFHVGTTNRPAFFWQAAGASPVHCRSPQP